MSHKFHKVLGSFIDVSKSALIMKIKTTKNSSTFKLRVVSALVGLVASVACFAESPDYEDTTSKYQATYNWQKHPAFNSGSTPNPVNSLNSSAEHMFTFSTTAHWGMRTWEGGRGLFQSRNRSRSAVFNQFSWIGGLYQR